MQQYLGVPGSESAESAYPSQNASRLRLVHSSARHTSWLVGSASLSSDGYAHSPHSESWWYAA